VIRILLSCDEKTGEGFFSNGGDGNFGGVFSDWGEFFG
jgi:hypothetical protein